MSSLPGSDCQVFGEGVWGQTQCTRKSTCFLTGTGENNVPHGKWGCQVHSLPPRFFFPFTQPLSCPAFRPCSASGPPPISCSSHCLCPFLHAHSHPLPGINKRPKNKNGTSGCPYVGTDFVFNFLLQKIISIHKNRVVNWYNPMYQSLSYKNHQSCTSLFSIHNPHSPHTPTHPHAGFFF